MIGATISENRGYQWAGGRPNYSQVQTIRPPNSIRCMMGGPDTQGMIRVGSRHQGGAHVLIGDGAIKFITDRIEAGNQAGNQTVAPTGAGQPSVDGLWGRLGSRASKEIIDSDF